MLKILLILLMLLVLARKAINIDSTPMVYSAKIIMYGRDSCGYTLKMKKAIAESNNSDLFEYRDITMPHFAKEYKNLGAAGVPAFQYDKKVVVGAMPVKSLLKKFNVMV